MSIHPSLSISAKDKKQRSVLKRTERIRLMMEKGDWKEGDDVYRLPKLKTIKIKIKKEKAEKATDTTTAAGAAPATAEAQATKEQAPAKTTASKGQEKK